MLATFILALALQTAQIEVDGVSLDVEIADHHKAKEKGLSGRDHLEEGKGMLFVYKKPQILYFCMRETKIPLSIGFFDKEKTLINIEVMNPLSPRERAIPLSQSALPAQYALEVPQGWFQRNHIQPGAKFSFRKSISQVK